MTIEMFTKKVENWKKTFSRETALAIKSILTTIKREVKQGYSGSPVGVRTGRTRSAIRHEYDKKGMQARVFVGKERAYIANFQETKNRPNMKYARKPVFEPIREKYSPEVANKILKKLIGAYRRV